VEIDITLINSVDYVTQAIVCLSGEQEASIGKTSPSGLTHQSFTLEPINQSKSFEVYPMEQVLMTD